MQCHAVELWSFLHDDINEWYKRDNRKWTLRPEAYNTNNIRYSINFSNLAKGMVQKKEEN